MISFNLKWTFKEYKEQLLIGLRRIYLMVHHNVSLMILCWESVHLNAGYHSAYVFLEGLIHRRKFEFQNRLGLYLKGILHLKIDWTSL